jgi:hypothetical protein
MGLQTFGFPSETVIWLSKLLDLNVFVEAGTFHGESALRASKIFSRVITIEKSSFLFMQSSKRLKRQPNIACYNGCTREHVTTHLRELDNPLFWLDAHWSGGMTSGQKDECPILDELSLIFAKGLNCFAILIDDARLFTAPPPRPHDRNQWPRIDELAKMIPDNCSMYIHSDIIYILPSEFADDFSGFMQSLTTIEWNTPSEVRNKPTLFNIVKMLMPIPIKNFLKALHSAS